MDNSNEKENTTERPDAKKTQNTLTEGATKAVHNEQGDDTVAEVGKEVQGRNRDVLMKFCKTWTRVMRYSSG